MIKLTKSLALLAVVAGFSACNSTVEKTTPSGLTYTVVKQGEGQPVEDGNFLLLNMIYKDGSDSVWVDTKERGVPMVIMKQDSVWKNSEGSIEQVFLDLKPGDSVQFSVKANDLFQNTWKAPIPEGVDPEGMFKFVIGVDKSMNQQELRTWQQEMMAKQQKIQAEKAAEQLSKDVETIDSYLAENGIEAEKTDSGLRYVITEEGNGKKAEKGDVVEVNYVGKVLNGPYFDTSIESVAKEQGLYKEQREYKPFELTLGTGGVIKGWDEGLTYLTEGAKATLYIPSPLAYGPRARSAEIGPNSILVFDVELVSVKKGEE